MVTTYRQSTGTVRNFYEAPCSVATVTLAGSLERKLAAAAYAGFGAVEICQPDLDGSGLGPGQVAEIAAGLGLEISLWQPLRDADGVPPGEFPAVLDRARRAFETTAELGADTIILCSNVSPSAIGDFSLTVDQLGDIADLAMTWGIRVAVEALSWGTWVHSYEHAWALVKTVGRDNLGACLDSFHILARGEGLAGIGRIPAAKIFAVQLADAPQMTLDYLSWSRHHRCFPLQGDLPVAEFTAAVAATGYRGWRALEIFSDRLRQQDPMLTAAQGMASLASLTDRHQPLSPVIPRQRGSVEQHA